MENTQPHRMPDAVKHQIIDLKQQNVAPKIIIKEIMSRFQRKTSHASIRQVWQKYQETGSASDLPKSGRSKVLNEREERAIVRNFLANPGTSIVPRTSARGKEITKMWKKDLSGQKWYNIGLLLNGDR